MKPSSVMFIAGEPSGDQLAAELARALRRSLVVRSPLTVPDPQPLRTGLDPRFFGAGGPALAGAGVELLADLTQHAVIGVSDAVRKYGRFRRLFQQLLGAARERTPDAIVLVDFSGFNLRFAAAIREWVRGHQGWFNAWRPKLVYYVSPQVWASRSQRVYAMARDLDLVLSILPFEKAWYAARVPALRVEFVGHPMVDRYPQSQLGVETAKASLPLVLLLPGSRPRELERHLPLMAEAAQRIIARRPARFVAVVPAGGLDETARAAIGDRATIEVHAGDLPRYLAQADVAIAATGTVMLECAFFGLPAVAVYRTSWIDYQIARRLIQVPYLALPNLLAGEEVYPEYIQYRARPGRIAYETLDLLNNSGRRASLKKKLDQVVASLGPPGAASRAAEHIAELLCSR